MKTTHTTRSIRIAMALLVMLTMALTASATVTNFVSDVMLIGNSSHTSFDNQVSDSVAAGWTDINKDLNAGCGSGSDYIHLLYKTVNSTGSSGFPITGFYIRTGANPPASLTYDERTYYRVPCAGSNNFVNSLGDLNRGAGGEYIFLYYTKDAFSTHESVITITVDNTQDGGIGANGGDTGYNLNEGCSSSSAQHIYMHVATQLPEGTTAPQRHLDACTGGENSIHVQGWTFDPDAPWASLDVHVYVYTDASCSSQSQYGQVHVLYANVPRPDVNNAYHIVGNHGFEATIPIADVGNYWVKVWAINYNGGSNPQIGATTAVAVTHTVTLTSQSGEVLLQDGDILTGTGGADTHVKIADGATVTLSGVSITDITNDNSHRWAGITCLGDAVIILEGGTTNSVRGVDSNPGIDVPSNKTLTIQGGGTVTANGGHSGAGIGGRNHGSCGSITICGGTVTANGGEYGAGIGGGDRGSCGSITISGGTVTANGGKYGAGIGGGDHGSCGSITISGGTVTANGGYVVAGIGSGYEGTCGNITITNGVTRVTATAGQYCNNAIGAGKNGTCGTVTIGGVETGFITQSPFVTFPYTVAFDANDGTGTMDDQEFMYNFAQNLNLNSFTRTNYLFDGWATSADGPKVYNDGQSVSNLTDTIATVNLYAKWRTHYVELTPTIGEVLLLDGDTLTGTGGANTHVSIVDSATVTFSGVNITDITNDNSHHWAGITCLGDAVIILEGNTTNSVRGGYKNPGIYIPAYKTLTLQGGGTLNATGNRGAGIGSGYSYNICGNIVINSGIINATGGDYCAGIGSGFRSTFGTVTISGGTVTVNGGNYGAGIGGGYDNSTCGDITISGGTVTATGGNSGAGIGSGDHSTCGDIAINGGNITATGGQYASGIGSGDHSTCGNITITNGVTMVTAIKGQNCSNAIGAGSNSTCQTVTIGGVETGFITQSPFVTFPYTVAFNANGGTGSMDDQILMYNVAQNLNANSFTRTHYQFDGWATLANGPKVYDDGQSVSNLADTIATVTFYAKWYFVSTKDIEGYGDVSNPGGWYLIASPVVEAIVPSSDNGFITNAFDLYYFDPSFVGEEWRDYETNNFFLTNGTGYLYASEISTTLTFTGTPYTGDGEIELAYNTNVPDFGGWNLVGNPFAETAYVDRDFYVMNPEGSEIIVAEGSTVEPMEGFFVVADNEDDVVHITPTDPDQTHSKIVLNLTQGRGSVIDRAIVRFGNSRQLPKLMFYEANTKMYIPQGGSDYSVIRSDGSGKLPVNFKPAEDGTYLISTKVKNVDVSSLYLVDHLRGIKVDLLNEPEYQFDAKVTDKPNRFELVYKSGVSPFVHQWFSRKSVGEEFGFVSDGNLIINNEGKSVLQVIDVTGRILSSETINGSYNKQIDAAPGVYLLRLINGDDVKTQKIIIE